MRTRKITGSIAGLILASALSLGAIDLAPAAGPIDWRNGTSVASWAPTFIPNGWWRGNTHTHSILSDGDSPPETVVARYMELGYDFLVLTDHNIVSDFAQYSTADFTSIPHLCASSRLCSWGSIKIVPSTLQRGRFLVPEDKSEHS